MAFAYANVDLSFLELASNSLVITQTIMIRGTFQSKYYITALNQMPWRRMK